MAEHAPVLPDVLDGCAHRAAPQLASRLGFETNDVALHSRPSPANGDVGSVVKHERRTLEGRLGLEGPRVDLPQQLSLSSTQIEANHGAIRLPQRAAGAGRGRVPHSCKEEGRWR